MSSGISACKPVPPARQLTQAREAGAPRRETDGGTDAPRNVQNARQSFIARKLLRLRRVKVGWPEMPFRGAFGEFTRNQELTLDLPAKPFVRLRIACDRVQ